jgi:predicted alternative tryptophan synthase beta-subunit
MMTKNQVKLAEIVSNYLEYIDGKVYSNFIHEYVRNKTDDKLAKKYIKIAEQDPEKVVDLIVDDSYYKALGYPMDRKKKKSKKSTKRKLCKCKK